MTQDRRPSIPVDADTEPSRVEHDSLGEVTVPAAARYGAQTQRAIGNFTVSGTPLDLAVVHALAAIKEAAAEVNAEQGDPPALSPAMAVAIAAAAREVVEGAWDDQFPIDTFQTGSGTSTNMNVNEVVASLANERLAAGGQRRIHPNDHVNAGQSSNDAVPSAIRIAALAELKERVLPALTDLALVLRAKAGELATVVKPGRTHTMDATPILLGDELGGYASQVEATIARLEQRLTEVGQLPLGGTATGNGLNAPPGFAAAVIARLAASTGLPLTEAPDHFAVQGAQDALVELSGSLRTGAIALFKIANDIRWLASGPRAGLGEVRLPALQPGSSIMPGKVNPVICEVVTQVGAQIVGHDAAIAFAGSQGTLELNTYLPVIATNLLASLRLLAGAADALAHKAVAGLEADAARARRLAESSPAIATVLAPVIGYEATAGVVQHAMTHDLTITEAALALGVLPEEELTRLLDVDAMAGLPSGPAGTVAR